MSNYWRKREEEHMQKSKRTDAQLARQLRKNQEQAMKDIQQQIDAFYGKYAGKEGITMQEARKRAEKLDIEAYAEKAKKYVEYAHSDNPLIQAKAFTDRANEEMRLYNVTMRINRLELLKANINLEIAKAGSAEEHFLQEKLTENARKENKRLSGILGETIASNEKQFNKIVNASFLSATWSERLWVNQEALRDELNALLNRGIVQGKHPRELARDMRKRFDVSKGHSERLLITEMARIQTDVQMDAFEKMGIDSYEYIAEAGACFKCEPLDGEVFKIKDRQTGANAPPLHPNCRCSTSPATDREGKAEKPDKTGKTEEVAAELLEHEDFKTRIKEEEKMQKEIDSLREQMRSSPDKKERRRLLDELEERFENEEISTKEYSAGLAAIRERFASKSKPQNIAQLRGQMYDLSKELDALKESHARENAADVKRIFSEYRNMGAGGIDLKSHLTSTRSQASKPIMDAYDHLPNDWIRRSVEAGKITPKKEKRGYYQHSTSTIAISGQAGERNAFRTALHELTHRQEYVNADILAAEKEFYEKRTKGEPLVKLRDVSSSSGYSAKELTRKDDFINPYMGKDYDGRAYELLTMGLDTLYTRPLDLAKDPEMFGWVVKTILTK